MEEIKKSIKEIKYCQLKTVKALALKNRQYVEKFKEIDVNLEFMRDLMDKYENLLVKLTSVIETLNNKL